MGKEFRETISGILALIVSIAATVTAIQKEQWRDYAIAFAVLGLCGLGWVLFRRYQRRQQFRRVISQRGEVDRAVGFNGAISYSREDASRFYGREHDIVSIAAQIQQDNYRLGVLYGESGVGKTSIIQAGLMPRLEKNAQCVSISLNNLPRQEAQRESALSARQSADELIQFLLAQVGKKLSVARPCANFGELLQKLSSQPHPTTILFLDQFEQIFARAGDETRDRFAQALEKCCQQSEGSLKIVVSVRADYFGLVYEMFDLEKSLVYLLRRFNQPQGREVIRKSSGFAEKLGETQPDHPLLAFEDEILSDLKDSDGRIHPVEISLICWIMLKTEGQLAKTKYIEGGRKQDWLDRYLDEVLQSSPNQQHALQLLSSLIVGDKSDTLAMADIAARSGLATPETQRLLDYFEQSKIIVKEVAEA